VTLRGPTTLTCKEVVELVTEYLSNVMSPEDRVRLEQHLLVCPPCTSYLGQIRSTIEFAAGLRQDRTVEPVRELVDLFRRWSQKK
jgi:predicted anti-sigma-YlaC factor YlaD